MTEIGSNFWLSPAEIQGDGIIDSSIFRRGFEDSVYTSTGRGAMAIVLRDIEAGKERRKVALLPPFTCRAVVEPFLNAGYKVVHYQVDRSLYLSANTLQSDIARENPSLVLFHNYFGFNTCLNINAAISDMRRKGIIVLEDITHSLYSSYPRLESDYTVGSFRKWAALPDGGFALKQRGEFRHKPLRPDVELEQSKLAAMFAKYNYILHQTGDKPSFLRQFQMAEQLLSSRKEEFAMSNAARVIQAGLDIAELKKKRRENYAVLFDEVRCLAFIEPVFSLLANDEVPLYLPLFCHCDRSALQNYLRKSDIYAPIVWPKPAYLRGICDEAEEAYERALCIPIDQRYGAEDMRRIAICIKEFTEKQ